MISTVRHNAHSHAARKGSYILQHYALGIITAAILPTVAFAIFLNDGRVATIQLITGIGCATAITAGFVGFRKLHLFPGSYSGYIAMSMTFAYGALAVAMLMLRL